jgi:hypothetical protein
VDEVVRKALIFAGMDVDELTEREILTAEAAYRISHSDGWYDGVQTCAAVGETQAHYEF